MFRERSPDKSYNLKNKKEKRKVIREMELMNFDEFKNAVAEGVGIWLPDSFEVADIKLNTVVKNNNLKLTGLIITGKGSNVAPTIYLESFYERYQEGMEFTAVLRNIADMRMEHDVKDGIDTSQFLDFERCRDRILPKLINYKSNDLLVNERPHTRIEDLAVTYYIDLGTDKNGAMSINITNQIAMLWDKSTEELHQTAVDNLTLKNEGKFKSITEVLRESFALKMNGEIDEETQAIFDMMEKSSEKNDTKMYVLSNKTGMYGANQILNENMITLIEETVGDDFFIIPSSIHELIIIRNIPGMNPDDLTEMVQSVNDTELSQEEILSYSVYKCSKKEGFRKA